MSIANPVPVSPPDAIAAIAPASPRSSSASADYQAPVLKMVNFLFLDKEEIAILRRIQVLTNNGEHLCVLFHLATCLTDPQGSRHDLHQDQGHRDGQKLAGDLF